MWFRHVQRFVSQYWQMEAEGNVWYQIKCGGVIKDL